MEVCCWLASLALSFSVFFPSLCTCLSSINCFGDHLLGCLHCFMRICHHDFLLASFIVPSYKNIQDSFRNNVSVLMTIQGQEIYFIQFSVWSFCLLQCLCSPAVLYSVLSYILLCFLCWAGHWGWRGG